jgi:LacI family transcriptional regulator
MIVPDISNSFFSELALEIEEAAFERGYTLLLGNAVREGTRQDAYLRAFVEHQIAGVLIVNAPDGRQEGLSASAAEIMRRASVPLVFVDRLSGNERASSLVVDNESGGYLATNHLISHGHSAIYCLSGPTELSPVQGRTLGWRRAMLAANLSVTKSRIITSSFDRQDAKARALQLLQRRQDVPTALFVHSDEQAIGVLHAAASLGVRVPEDVAVVSFDGTRESAMTLPTLSTVAQPVREMGRRAVQMLLERRKGSKVDSVSEVLPVRLIKRRSCGCPEIPEGRTGVNDAGRA